MTEHETIAGNVYCVTCAEGCTVTDASGQLNEECEAGKQLHITAPSGVLFTSAPATVRKVNFKNAPVKLKLLGLLGGGVSTGLPSGYLAAEFLESTGTQYIKVALPFTPNTRIVTRAALRDKETNQSVYSIMPQGMPVNGYGFYLSGGVQYPNTFAFNGSSQIYRNFNLMALTPYQFEVDGYKIRFKGAEYSFSNAPSKTFDKFILFAIAKRLGDEIASGSCIIYGFEYYDATKLKLTPALDSNGTPCMFDKITKQPFYNNGTDSFIVGMTIAQARKLSKLPAGGGSLTVSLPSNYLEDEGVTNAIAAANAKDWNIKVASTFEADGASTTFALRRIWVRKTLDEQGNYIDSDGVRWRVESCVAMYNADGSEPDAHGYEPFRSVDAAVEYWGLTAWVNPEAEELLTNTEEQ